MLAYLFWHRPADGTDPGAYEDRLRAFHAALALPGSRTLRLRRAPYDRLAAPAYEDWYPVENWAALGALNDRAVSGPRRAPHDAAAARAAEGDGGVYRLLHGRADAPVDEAAWLAKPSGLPYDAFLAALREAAGDAAIWQRQMVLGPAPEFGVLAPGPVDLPWPAVRTGPAPI